MLGDSHDDFVSDDCPNLHCELTPMTIKEQQRSYYLRNKDKVLARSKAYYESHKDQHRVSARKYKLRTKYGLTLEQYEAMLAAQNGKCSICKNAHDKMCVDHCHSSGRIRGILCDPCNTAIGLLKDNPYVVKSARDYLILNM